MSTRPGQAARRLLLPFLLALGTASGAWAQQGQPRPEITFKEPVPSRVYQRGANELADIPVTIDKAPEGAKIVSVAVNPRQDHPFEEGKIRGLPAGKHQLRVGVEVSGHVYQTVIPNVTVGDLWVLAGQSNMEGVGNLLDVTPPDPNVSMLAMDGRWSQAKEPLHWLVDSPDPVHSGDPATREARAAESHKGQRGKGAGLGLPFGVALTHATNVPIGLVVCAHGGTSMAQWDPAKKGEGGNSLYGSMLRQVGLAGGR